MNPIVLDANLRMPVLWKDVAKGSRESAGAYRNFRAAVRDYLGEGYVTVYPGCTAAWDTISGSVQKRVVQFSMNGPVPALASVPSVFIEPGDLTWYDCDQVWYSAMDMETGLIPDLQDHLAVATAHKVLRVLDLACVSPWRNCGIPEKYPIDAVVLRSAAFGVPAGLAAIWSRVDRYRQNYYPEIDTGILQAWSRVLDIPDHVTVARTMQSAEQLAERVQGIRENNTVVVRVPIQRELAEAALAARGVLPQGYRQPKVCLGNPYALRKHGRNYVVLALSGGLRDFEIENIVKAFQGLEHLANIQQVLERTNT